MRSAVRNTCFAILASIETDMRETIGDLALAANSLDMLPTDVRKNAAERFELDENHTPGVQPENDIDLIDYTDFGDLVLQLYFLEVPEKKQEPRPEGPANSFFFRGLKPPAPSGIFEIQL